jgi:hypothetical protein
MTISLTYLQDCSNRTGSRTGPLEKVVRLGEFVADLSRIQNHTGHYRSAKGF